MKNRKLLLIVSLVLALTMSLGGTLAYLQDTDEAVNVMTLGNVQIEQIELQRAENVAYNAGEAGKNDEGVTNGVKRAENALVPFVQGQALYPAFPAEDGAYTAEATDLFFWGDYVYSGTAGNGLWNDSKLKGSMDKFVFVENKGTSDCYFRTWLAFECPEGMEYSQGSDKEFMMNRNVSTYEWAECGYITIDDVRYFVRCATYKNALAAGNTSHPSLLQVVMTHNATNEDMDKLGGTYEILAFTQAVQTNNFPDYNTALNAAFGPITSGEGDNLVVNHPWTEGVEVKTYEGVIYAIVGDTATVSAGDGNTLYRGILSDGKSTVTNVDVEEGITRLNDRALCKAPTITSVELPSTLTYIDESVFQQSGITTIEIPENVTYIGKQAMGACGNLESIVIKAKNVTIANYVARACANLKEVYIYSDSVTFESGSMYFTNKENGDASGITF